MHRMFVDEIGNSDLASSEDPNHRYLSLTGVILDLAAHRTSVIDELNRLKQEFFGSTLVVLHRRELLNRTPPFHCLVNDQTRQRFDSRLLELLSSLPYTVITVVIDKREHLNRYAVWRAHPYHYCLECLLERYIMWLERRNARGDVLFESRGRRDDDKLKRSYRGLYADGTTYVNATRIRDRLTSREIKVKRKQDNIAGLQIADMLAHPSFMGMRCARLGETMTAAFGLQLTSILEELKYDRNQWGSTRFAKKWLP